MNPAAVRDWQSHLFSVAIYDALLCLPRLLSAASNYSSLNHDFRDQAEIPEIAFRRIGYIRY